MFQPLPWQLNHRTLEEAETEIVGYEIFWRQLRNTQIQKPTDKSLIENKTVVHHVQGVPQEFECKMLYNAITKTTAQLQKCFRYTEEIVAVMQGFRNLET